MFSSSFSLFKDFLSRKMKKKPTKSWVLDLVEISKDFLIFIDLKISETRLSSLGNNNVY